MDFLTKLSLALPYSSDVHVIFCEKLSTAISHTVPHNNFDWRQYTQRAPHHSPTLRKHCYLHIYLTDHGFRSRQHHLITRLTCGRHR
ncbi:hypothetical protein GCK32_020236 [Trichostrongylus colubriformis]|uniref:Uncharacterized protein n=1 Tax=Trichostrongylus colubriformis TaxID=6319 RepID=A0AAN8FJC5_TRICO